MILLHISINFTVRGGLLNSKCEHEALGLMIPMPHDGHGDPSGFILNVAGEEEGLEKQRGRVGSFCRSTTSFTLCSDNKGFVFMTKASLLMVKRAELRRGRIELIRWEKAFVNRLARLFRTASN